jgi:hypothetical protein
MMPASGTRYIYNSSLSCCIQVITFLISHIVILKALISP